MPDDKTKQATPPDTPAEESGGQQDSLIGEVVGGRFRVEQKIGQGGMGVVYKATQTGLERDVVVKVLSEDRMGDSTSIKRFEREAKSLSKIDHSNIVTIHDFGQEADLGYIVMEYVDGIRLDQLIEHRSGLSIDVLGPIAVQILDAVGEAHRLGLIHRDLKPSNIMLTERRGFPHFVKILDFGLAKLVSGATEVTADDSIVGSVPFLSPEQIKGTEVDQRVDVYALGIVFYYALTGRKPFQGSNANVLYDQVHNAPPPLRLHVQDPDAIPKGITDLIEETLRKDPAERPSDAKEFLDRMFEAARTPDQIAPPWMQSGDSSGNVERHAAPPDSQSRGGQQQNQAEGSQEYLKAPPSTSDALKQVNTTSGRAKRRDSKSSQKARRSPGQAGGTEDIDEGGGGTLTWVLGGALVAVLAAGGFAVYSGKLDLGVVQSSGSSAAAVSGASLPENVKETADEIDQLITAGDIDEAEKRLDNVARRAPQTPKWNTLSTSLRERIDARRALQRADQHIADGKLEKAKGAYRQANEVLLDETLTWKLNNVEKLGVIKTKDLPEGALLADGHTLDRDSPPLVVPAGERTITVRRDGKENWSQKKKVEKGKSVTLAASDGKSEDEASEETEKTAGGSEQTDPQPEAESGSESEGSDGPETWPTAAGSADDSDKGGSPGDEETSESSGAEETDGSKESDEKDSELMGSDWATSQDGHKESTQGSEDKDETSSGASGQDDQQKQQKEDGPGLLPVE